MKIGFRELLTMSHFLRNIFIFMCIKFSVSKSESILNLFLFIWRDVWNLRTADEYQIKQIRTTTNYKCKSYKNVVGHKKNCRLTLFIAKSKKRTFLEILLRIWKANTTITAEAIAFCLSSHIKRFTDGSHVFIYSMYYLLLLYEEQRHESEAIPKFMSNGELNSPKRNEII